MEKNVFKFGKYKGKTIVETIITHIGYIMWCLENINSFKLNTEEQELYDAWAIAIKKYEVQMTFPIDKMLKYVKNTTALKNFDTPFIMFPNGKTVISEENINKPVCQLVREFFNLKENNNKPKLNINKVDYVDYNNAYADKLHFPDKIKAFSQSLDSYMRGKHQLMDGYDDEENFFYNSMCDEY